MRAQVRLPRSPWPATAPPRPPVLRALLAVAALAGTLLLTAGEPRSAASDGPGAAPAASAMPGTGLAAPHRHPEPEPVASDRAAGGSDLRAGGPESAPVSERTS